MRLCCYCSSWCVNWFLITAAVSRHPQHWQHMFGKSFGCIVGLKWPGQRNSPQKYGISPVLTDYQWALWETGMQQCLHVSEYSYVFEACKSFDVKSRLHLNSLFQHFQVFACFWGEISWSAIFWGGTWTLACLETWVFACACFHGLLLFSF